MPVPDSSPPTSRRSLVVFALVVFALAFALSLLLHRKSALHDTDAYFHLALARLYVEEGVHASPPLRFSLLGAGIHQEIDDEGFEDEGFGDKELLFHLSLVPFVVAFDDPIVAGRVALAAWAGLVAAILAGLAARVVGPWGMALPFWLFLASTEFSWRLVRLRPELLSLFLLLAAVAALATRRDRLLGLVTLLFTLGYTAFHALIGLVGLFFLATGWSERRWPWRTLLYAALGAGLGLLVHPHFPANLEIWAVQNIRFFLDKANLDVGTEIRPNTTDVLLLVNLGFFAGLVALGLASREGAPATDEERRGARALGLAVLAFGALYLLMSRFSLYAVPLVALFVLYELRRRGRAITGRVRLPGRGSLPLALVAILCVALSLPEAWRQLGLYLHRTDLGPDRARIVDRERLAAALPAGARVAADWGPTATYLLWAPQARYLNALDPHFLAVPYPEKHRALRAVLDGRAPDVPAATLGLLESDYLAFPTVRHDALVERLKDDPRVELLHRGSHTLVRFRPAPDAFVLDWRVVPPSQELPPSPDAPVDAWPPWPRAADPATRAIEGYVDAERVAPEAPCVAFARSLPDEAPVEIEITSRGPATLWLGDRRVLALARGTGAVVGGGARLTLAPETRDARVVVLACEDDRGEKGFYWRESR